MPDTTVRTYDPKQVIVTFGAVILSGFAEGTMVQISRNGDLFDKVRGADGGVDRVNKNASDFSVTATLKQTSPVNTALSVIQAADTKLNAGVFPLTVTDLSGTTLFVAPNAWIGKDPDDEFGDSMSNREWRFDTGIAEKLSGGN